MLPLIPTWIVAGPAGSGKTALIHGLSQGAAADATWTVLLNGQNPSIENTDWPAGVHRIQLAGGCACCTSRIVFHTHLSRTLRLRRPERLFIEVSGDSHPEGLLRQLGEPQWQSWLDLKGVLTVVTPLQSGHAQVATETLVPISRAVILNRVNSLSAPQVDSWMDRLMNLSSGSSQGNTRFVSVPQIDLNLKPAILWPLSQLEALEKT